MGKTKSTITSFKPGDLVFAKVKGYSHWPSRIESVPTDKQKGKYQVFFYGTHETYSLKAEFIFPYEEYKDVYGKSKKSRGFNEGMQEIETNPHIIFTDNEENSNQDAKNSIEDNAEQEKLDGESNSSNENDVRKLTDSSISTTTKKSNKPKKESHVGLRTRASKRRHTMVSEEMIEKSETTNSKTQNVNKRQKLSSVDPSIELNNEEEKVKLVEEKVKLVEEKVKLVESNSSELTSEKESQISSESNSLNENKIKTEPTSSESKSKESESSPSPKEEEKTVIKSEKKVSLSVKFENAMNSEHRKKLLIEKARWFKMTGIEREAEILKEKQKKIEEKKREKIKNIRIQLALLKMDMEIKKSLQLDNTDENRCCMIMEDLIKLPISQKHLFKAPEIVETIKKCRKFKNSEKVRKYATDCFYKFHYMFPISENETFWSVFEKEREKYLGENVEELKRERNFANKLQLEAGNASSTTKIANTNVNHTVTNTVSIESSSQNIKSNQQELDDQQQNQIKDFYKINSCTIESPVSSNSSSITQSPLSASSNNTNSTL